MRRRHQWHYLTARKGEDMKMPPFPELPLRAIEGWDADDLYDFARAYGELVREECAKHVEAMTANWEGTYKRAADLIPPAIRSGA
jgi:hypothetical protein